MFFTKVPLFATFFTLAAAGAVKRQSAVPAITYPHAGTEWFSGQTHNVTWTTPANGTADLFLGAGETLGTGTPFLSGVDLSAGRVIVTVPSVPVANVYELVFSSGSAFGTPSAQFGIGEPAGPPGSSSVIIVTSATALSSSSVATNATATTTASGASNTTTATTTTSTTNSTTTAVVSVSTSVSTTASVSASTSVTTSTGSSTTVTLSSVISSTTSLATTVSNTVTASPTSPAKSGTSTGSGSSASPTTTTGAAVRIQHQAVLAALPAAVAAFFLL